VAAELELIDTYMLTVLTYTEKLLQRFLQEHQTFSPPFGTLYGLQ